MGAVAADRQGVGVDEVGHLLDAAQALGRVAQGLQVGDDCAAAAALLEVGVGRVDTGVDHRDRDALAGELAAVGAGDRLGRLVAAGRLVGGVLEEADRLRAGLDVRHAGLGAHRLDLALGAASADDADLAERHALRHAGGRHCAVRVSEGRAVHEDRGLAGQRAELLAEVRRQVGLPGGGTGGHRRSEAEREDGSRSGCQGCGDAQSHSGSPCPGHPTIEGSEWLEREMALKPQRA